MIGTWPSRRLKAWTDRDAVDQSSRCRDVPNGLSNKGFGQRHTAVRLTPGFASALTGEQRLETGAVGCVGLFWKVRSFFSFPVLGCFYWEE